MKTLNCRSTRARSQRAMRWLATAALLSVGVLEAKAAGLPGADESAIAGAALRTLLALALIVAVIFSAAWLMRRVRVSATGASGIAVLAQLSVGARERVLWVRAGELELLLGVAPGQVRALAQWPATARGSSELQQAALTLGAGGAAPVSFKELLKRSLGR